jgi:hypothetical protein
MLIRGKLASDPLKKLKMKKAVNVLKKWVFNMRPLGDWLRNGKIRAKSQIFFGRITEDF